MNETDEADVPFCERCEYETPDLHDGLCRQCEIADAERYDESEMREPALTSAELHERSIAERAEMRKYD